MIAPYLYCSKKVTCSREIDPQWSDGRLQKDHGHVVKVKPTTRETLFQGCLVAYARVPGSEVLLMSAKPCRCGSLKDNTHSL